VVSPARARVLVVGGRDRLRFLHAVTTQDVEGLTPGAGAYGALTDDRGRPVSDFRLYVLPEAVLLEVPRGSSDALRATFERLIIADDVVLAWADGDLVASEAESPAGLLALVEGPRRTRGWFVPPVDALAGETPMIGWGAGTAAPPDDALADEATLASVPRLRQAMLLGSRYGGAGVIDWSGPRTEASAEATVDALEIAAGRPGPAEFAAARVFNELGRMDAVSFTKGCFMGQEILNRVHAQGNLQRRLVTLAFEDPVDMGSGGAGSGWSGALVTDASGEPAGEVTRAARAPGSDRPVAFAFVKRGAWTPGTRLFARAPGGGTSHSVEVR
jgi:folate-binding protein YgfZ